MAARYSGSRLLLGEHSGLLSSLRHLPPLPSTPLHSSPLHSPPLPSTPLHSPPLPSTQTVSPRRGLGGFPKKFPSSDRDRSVSESVTVRQRPARVPSELHSPPPWDKHPRVLSVTVCQLEDMCPLPMRHAYVPPACREGAMSTEAPVTAGGPNSSVTVLPVAG